MNRSLDSRSAHDFANRFCFGLRSRGKITLNMTEAFDVKLSQSELMLFSTGLQKLTGTEMEVLHHLINAKSCKEIALIRGVSHHTIESHKVNIKNKLGISSMRDFFRVAFGAMQHQEVLQSEVL